MRSTYKAGPPADCVRGHIAETSDVDGHLRRVDVPGARDVLRDVIDECRAVA